MYAIKTAHMDLHLKMAPLHALREHEAVIPEKAEQLRLQFRNWALLQNPVIVDEHLTVIDGHHRAHVLKRLNFKYIPVCKIDYFNEAVQLRYWFRSIAHIPDLDMPKRLICRLKGTLREMAHLHALKKRLAQNPLCLGFQHKGRFFSVTFPQTMVHDAVSAYDITDQIQEGLVKGGRGFQYIPCQSVLSGTCAEQEDSDHLILWTPQISKQMVMDAVRRNRRFGPKATRHLIPARPLNVNVPIYWLKEEKSLDVMNQAFLRLLEGKRLKRFGPGQIIDGRYYEEELFVFLQKKR
ncbi:MAG: ParB N-terminal domain-containing protein [Desulfobacteraceae bacterium]